MLYITDMTKALLIGNSSATNFAELFRDVAAGLGNAIEGALNVTGSLLGTAVQHAPGVIGATMNAAADLGSGINSAVSNLAESVSISAPAISATSFAGLNLEGVTQGLRGCSMGADMAELGQLSAPLSHMSQMRQTGHGMHI